jgi:FixJ family two-component response regulator
LQYFCKALNILRKPVKEQDFLERIEQESGEWKEKLNQQQVRQHIASLTERESEVFEPVAAGLANKVIASDLGISERTVEVHSSQVMKKLDVRTLAQLIHLQTE